MTLAATLGVGLPILEPSLEAAPETDVSIEQQTAAREGGIDLTVRASGDSLPAFQSGLDADSTVARWLTVARTDGCGLYRIRLTPRTADRIDHHDWTDGRVVVTATRWSGDGWIVEGLFEDRVALRAYASGCEASGIPHELVRVHEVDGPGDDSRYGLTELQSDSLRVAFDEGFYDVPRQSSLREVADLLDVSHQALSERLRRGVGTLVEATVASDDTALEASPGVGPASGELVDESVTRDRVVVADP